MRASVRSSVLSWGKRREGRLCVGIDAKGEIMKWVPDWQQPAPILLDG